MSKRAAYKVVVFGDGGVGKTTLIKKYTTGIFEDSTTMTIGVDFAVKKLTNKGQPVTLQLWDFMGEEQFRTLLPGFVSGADGGIFVFDITRFNSLQNLKGWTSIIKECVDETGKPVPLILVGGKLDLAAFRSVDEFYGKKLVDQKDYFIQYVECSSKTGENVARIFEALALEMLKRDGKI